MAEYEVVDVRDAVKETRKMRKALTGLTDDVRRCLAAIDAEMKRPSTPERGSRIAKICNALELQNDMARRFTLGILK